FNRLELSSWSRTAIVPLLILLDAKPTRRLPEELRLDELWLVPREQASLRFNRIPRPFSPRSFFWKNFFIGVDDCLKGWERLGPRPLRAKAIEAARQWLEKRIGGAGGLGGMLPPVDQPGLAVGGPRLSCAQTLTRRQLR